MFTKQKSGDNESLFNSLRLEINRTMPLFKEVQEKINEVLAKVNLLVEIDMPDNHKKEEPRRSVDAQYHIKKDMLKRIANHAGKELFHAMSQIFSTNDAALLNQLKKYGSRADSARSQDKKQYQHIISEAIPVCQEFIAQLNEHKTMIKNEVLNRLDFLNDVLATVKLAPDDLTRERWILKLAADINTKLPEKSITFGNAIEEPNGQLRPATSEELKAESIFQDKSKSAQLFYDKYRPTMPKSQPLVPQHNEDEKVTFTRR